MELLWIITTCVIFLPSISHSLDIDESCDPGRHPYTNSPGEYDHYRCDPTKGLYCNDFNSRCACYITESYYDYYYGRCMARVNAPCKATYTFSVPCGQNAECPYDTGICQCRHDYYPTNDRKGCTNSAIRTILHNATISLVTIVHLCFQLSIFTRL